MKPLYKIILAVVILISSFAKADTVNGVVLDKPESLPEFKLSDQFGNHFVKDNLNGKWSMIFVGFTSCPDVCPFTLANLEAVRAELTFKVSPTKIPNIVFLAVDPDRDKSVLKDYLSWFHPEYIGITGQREEIDTLVKGLDAFYRFEKPKIPGGHYQVSHSAAVAIVNPDAQIVAKISPPFKPEQTADFLYQVLRNRI